MNIRTIVEVVNGSIVLDDGSRIYDEHVQDCCENHYLDWDNADTDDLVGGRIDLDDFFDAIDGYGIRIKLLDNFPISIAGYSSNNGYYSANLTLYVIDKNNKIINKYDITDCQSDI